MARLALFAALTVYFANSLALAEEPLASFEPSPEAVCRTTLPGHLAVYEDLEAQADQMHSRLKLQVRKELLALYRLARPGLKDEKLFRQMQGAIAKAGYACGKLDDTHGGSYVQVFCKKSNADGTTSVIDLGMFPKQAGETSAAIWLKAERTRELPSGVKATDGRELQLRATAKDETYPFPGEFPPRGAWQVFTTSFGPIRDSKDFVPFTSSADVAERHFVPGFENYLAAVDPACAVSDLKAMRRRVPQNGVNYSERAKASNFGPASYEPGKRRRQGLDSGGAR